MIIKVSTTQDAVNVAHWQTLPPQNLHTSNKEQFDNST